MTFISANVINRQAVLTHFPNFNASSEFNTYLPSWHGLIAHIASNSHSYISTPMFGALAGNTGGYKLIEVFGINLINITRKYLEDSIPNAERVMSNAVITAIIPGGLMSQYSDSKLTSKFEYENTSEVLKSVVLKTTGALKFY